MQEVVERRFALSEEDLTASSNSGKIVNSKTRYALSEEHWRPKIGIARFDKLKERVRSDIKRSQNEITETSNWMFTNIYGLIVFAIYSTENWEKPTLLYESKGDKAIKERDILLKILEVYNNVGSINRESDFVDRLLGGNWMQQGGGIQHSAVSLGRQSGGGNAGVLQRSSSGKPRGAFKTVLENLFEVQERLRLNRLGDDSGKMTVSEKTWNEAIEIGIDSLEKFAKEEGVKREISRQGLTERECQELIKRWNERQNNLSGGRTKNDRRGKSEAQGVPPISSRNGEEGAVQEGQIVNKSTDAEYLELAKEPEKNEARLSEMIGETVKVRIPVCIK